MPYDNGDNDIDAVKENKRKHDKSGYEDYWKKEYATEKNHSWIALFIKS